MAREMQFIGLNQYARNYVQFHENHGNIINKYSKEVFDSFPYDETPILGFTYIIRNDSGDLVLQEIVQVVAFSSGPMFFTCLKPIKLIRKGKPDVHYKDEFWFKWMIDPMLAEGEFDEEFDYETGRYWV